MKGIKNGAMLLLVLLSCKRENVVESKSSEKIIISASCRLDSTAYQASIQNIVFNLTGIPYSMQNKTDCSGIFYKSLEQFKSANCPKSTIPKITQYRSSDDFAFYLSKQNRLHTTLSVGYDDWLRIGTVLFYGYSKKRVNHVALVTAVNKNAQGIIESYSIFHGRKPGIASSVSKVKLRATSSSPAKALALWDQQVLAYAYIEDFID